MGTTAVTGQLPDALLESNDVVSTKLRSRECCLHQMNIGACGMQGRRGEMEDEHLVVDLERHGCPGHVILAVFDGHGGDIVSKSASSIFIDCLTSTQHWRQYIEGGLFEKEESLRLALFDTFQEVDVSIKNDLEARGKTTRAGSTACVLVITPKSFICANAGDSRCVLRRASSTEDLSSDHRPDVPSEKQRIELANGFVDRGRVNSNLAVSRGLGDYEFKSQATLAANEQIISCVPDVTIVERRPDDVAVVLACDGLWDVASSEEVTQKVEEIFESGEPSLQLIAEELLDWACEDLQSGDNVSCVVVRLPGAKVGNVDVGGGVIRIRTMRERRKPRDPYDSIVGKNIVRELGAEPQPGSPFFGLDDDTDDVFRQAREAAPDVSASSTPASVVAHEGVIRNGKLFVIRHGERMDEDVSLTHEYEQWKIEMRSRSRSEERSEFIDDDPCLTQRGHLQATEAGKTLRNLLLQSQGANLRCIFTSKLQRAVETAYRIALELKVPMFVSSTLTVAAAAVEIRVKCGIAIDFLSIEEIRLLCPGIDVYDCDDPMSERHIPALPRRVVSARDLSNSTIAAMPRSEEVIVVVGHRETIRNLTHKHASTPYACLSIYQQRDGNLIPETILSNSGETVEQKQHALTCFSNVFL